MEVQGGWSKMGETFKNIRFERDDKINIITIDRPERKNAINIDTMMELKVIVEQIKQDSKILALILTEGGDEAFISVEDLKYFKTLDSLQKGREMSILGGNLLDSIEGFNIPVIAAINGYAFGGAVNLRWYAITELFGKRHDSDSDRSTWVS